MRIEKMTNPIRSQEKRHEAEIMEDTILGLKKNQNWLMFYGIWDHRSSVVRI